MYFKTLNKKILKIKEPEIQEYCDLCGRQYPGKFYEKGRNYQILACKRCALIWTKPLKYYSAEKLKISTYWAEKIYLANADVQKTRFRNQLEIFFKKVNVPNLNFQKVLEVGSGFGFFLDVCEEVGIIAEGCDISEKAVICNAENTCA